MKPKNILVTGGAGFIGTSLCSVLLELGYHVTVLDNLTTGSKSQISKHLDKKNFTFINGNVVDFKINRKFDVIFNLACPASPISYQKDPLETIKTSILGSLNVLSAADFFNSKILQASTSEIYGDPLISPQHENYWGNVNPIGLRSCYDEGKRASETLFVDSCRQKGTDIRIARIFNTYGPGMNPFDGRVISNFIVRALQGKPIEIYGTGSQIRSFCFIDDLIDGLIKLVDKIGYHFPVNLGNPDPVSILNLAQEILELTNSNSIIHFLPPVQDDPVTRIPDVSRASTDLNWTPLVSRREGLLKTISYFDKII